MNPLPFGVSSVIAQQHITEMRMDASYRRLARAKRERSSVSAPLWVRPQRAPATR